MALLFARMELILRVPGEFDAQQDFAARRWMHICCIGGHVILTLFHLSFRLSMSTKEEAKTEGKKAGKDAPPVSIGWDSHQAVVRTFSSTCGPQQDADSYPLIH